MFLQSVMRCPWSSGKSPSCPLGFEPLTFQQAFHQAIVSTSGESCWSVCYLALVFAFLTLDTTFFQQSFKFCMSLGLFEFLALLCSISLFCISFQITLLMRGLSHGPMVALWWASGECITQHTAGTSWASSLLWHHLQECSRTAMGHEVRSAWRHQNCHYWNF